MRTTNTSIAVYERPQCEEIKVDSLRIFCASTDGYIINPNHPTEDDWV